MENYNKQQNLNKEKQKLKNKINSKIKKEIVEQDCENKDDEESPSKEVNPKDPPKPLLVPKTESKTPSQTPSEFSGFDDSSGSDDTKKYKLELLTKLSKEETFELYYKIKIKSLVQCNPKTSLKDLRKFLLKKWTKLGTVKQQIFCERFMDSFDVLTDLKGNKKEMDNISIASSNSVASSASNKKTAASRGSFKLPRSEKVSKHLLGIGSFNKLHFQLLGDMQFNFLLICKQKRGNINFVPAVMNSHEKPLFQIICVDVFNFILMLRNFSCAKICYCFRFAQSARTFEVFYFMYILFSNYLC